MSGGGFVNAKFWDSLATGRWISITDFLGGLNEWRVTEDTWLGQEKTIRFEILNKTNLASGTRIGFTREGTAELSLVVRGVGQLGLRAGC